MRTAEIIAWIVGILVSYLVGSIPTGFIIGKLARGVDIRQFGSGNMGATNAMRVLGKGYGMLTLLIDVSKGFLAVFIIGPFCGADFGSKSMLILICGIAAIFGHNWTCFLNFRGGKGVATSAGVFLGLAPLVTLYLALIWGVVAFVTRYVSVASIIVSMALPVLLFIFDKPTEWVIAGFILSWIGIWKHRTNIKRLLAGTENRIGQRTERSSKSSSRLRQDLR